MEYSVYDLLRILLKKWYVVVLTMLLVGGAAAFLSQISYREALANYEDYTSRTAPVNTEIGDYTATYQCGFTVTDFSRYQAQYAQKNSFIDGYLAENDATVPADRQYADALDAFTTASADFSGLFAHSSVMAALQSFMAEQGYLEPATVSESGIVASEERPLTVADHFSVSVDDDGLATITITALPEATAKALASTYVDLVARHGNDLYSMEISTEHLTGTYTPRTPTLTPDAILSQTVMQKPEAAPHFLKAACKGAVFGFLFGCFGVLLYTFIKDTAPAEKRRRAGECAS